MHQDNEVCKLAEHVSEALNHSFVGMLRDYHPLVPFVEHPNPWSAYLALKMVDFLQDIQLEDYHLRPTDFRLKLLIAKSAAHPCWWIRYMAASLIPQSAPLRVYIRLLSDPEVAVIAKISDSLLELPFYKAEQIIRQLPARSQRVLRLYLNRWIQNKVLKELLPEEQQVAHALYTLLDDLPDGVSHSLDNHLERLQAISLTEWASLPSETIALMSSGFFPPFGRLVQPDIMDHIVRYHPDPVARVLALEWSASHPSDLALLQVATQEHLPMALSALLSLRWKVDAGNYFWLGRRILKLTYHPCLLVVQVAARTLKEAIDCSHPDERLVNRLMSLTDHPDPLVKVNALYSLQDYWAAPASICEHLLRFWAEERISVVKVAFARTLWWLMRPKEWWTHVGIWLWNFEKGRWRYLVRNLVSIWSSRDAEEALGIVRIATLRRLLLNAIDREEASCPPRDE